MQYKLIDTVLMPYWYGIELNSIPCKKLVQKMKKKNSRKRRWRRWTGNSDESQFTLT